MILRASREDVLADLLDLFLQGIGHKAAALNPEMNWDRLKSEYAKWNGVCAQKLGESFEGAAREPCLEIFFGPDIEGNLPYRATAVGAVQELRRLYDERLDALRRVRGDLGEAAGAG